MYSLDYIGVEATRQFFKSKGTAYPKIKKSKPCNHIIGMRGPVEGEHEDYRDLVGFNEGYSFQLTIDPKAIEFTYCPMCGQKFSLLLI